MKSLEWGALIPGHLVVECSVVHWNEMSGWILLDGLIVLPGLGQEIQSMLLGSGILRHFKAGDSGSLS